MSLDKLLEEKKITGVIGAVEGNGALEMYTTVEEYTPEKIGAYSDFKPGLAPNSIMQNSQGFKIQYRAGEHESYGKNHLNIDILNPIKDPVKTDKILDKIHIDFE